MKQFENPDAKYMLLMILINCLGWSLAVSFFVIICRMKGWL